MTKKDTGKNQIRCTVYSDGSVISLDDDNITIDELTGKWDVLHDVLSIYTNNMGLLKVGYEEGKGFTKYPKPLNFMGIELYFQISGKEEYINVPTTHLNKFIKYIVGNNRISNSYEELNIITN